MSNSLVLTKQYPTDKYNLLVPIQTVTEIAEIQKPVMNVVQISTNLEDKEICAGKGEGRMEGPSGHPDPVRPYQEEGLTKLMRAAGIKILSSRPVVPSTCQKCANMNAAIGKPVRCGACPNKDVKYECRISVPSLTGEDMEVVAHKEILVDDVVADMSDKQKAEFLKFRNEMCESKALNRALRTAMQIKGTYLIEEFKKPFVVAYLVPNLDNPDVKAEAVKRMFGAAEDIYGGAPRTRNTVFVEDDHEDNEYEAHEEPIDRPYNPEDIAKGPPPQTQQAATPDTNPDEDFDPNTCAECGVNIGDKISIFSIRNYGRPLCMGCQKKERK